MSFPQAIDFANNATPFAGANPHSANAYVDITAGGGTSINYPTVSPQGNNVGMESFNNGPGYNYKKDAGFLLSTDARLLGSVVGAHVIDIGTYRIDSDGAGARAINSAAGDFDYPACAQIEVFDTSISKGFLSSGITSARRVFKDANNIEYTPANWVSSQAPVSKTFSTTIMRFAFGDGVNGFTINYIEVGPIITPAFKSVKNLICV
jgi:hypothetical protein